MRAVGMITSEKSVNGQWNNVSLFLNNGEEVRMWLTNEDEVRPYNARYGLFEFSLEDQFCTWVDPNEALVLG